MKKLTTLFLLLALIYGPVKSQDATEYFDGNAYNVLLNSKGNHFWDYSDKQMFVPSAPGANAGPGTIFTSTIWIGGVEGTGSVHLAAERYGQSGRDFEPGPVADTYDSSSVALYNNLWKVNRAEIVAWLSNPSAQNPPQSVLDWPATGRNYAPYNEDVYLAPFVDVNGDGQYNPQEDHDYPDFKGDQAVYFMFNDDQYPNLESGGQSFGAEIRGLAYGYNCPEDTALNQTLFIHYEITNRSGNDYDDVYIGLWNDFDIGCGQDDYVGSDPLRNLFFAYNGDDNDLDCQGSVGYQTNVAAQGVRVLSGVFMDNDLEDNQPGVGVGEYANGFGFGDGIVDNEKLGLTSFMYHNNAAGPTGDPSIAIDYYNMLKGSWKDGSEVSHGGNGYDPNNPNAIPARFMFSDSSDTLNYATFGVAASPWSEFNAGNLPGDRRGLGNIGPFSMPPNKTASFDIAYVFAQSDQGSAASVDKMKAYSDHIQAFFNEEVDSPCVLSTIPGVGIEDAALATNWAIYPNPSNGLVTISSDNQEQFEIQVFNAQGALVAGMKSSASTEIIDLSSMSSGIYFIKTASASKSQIQKLILQ